MKLTICNEQVKQVIELIIQDHKDLKRDELMKKLKPFNLDEEEIDEIIEYLFDNEIIIIDDENVDEEFDEDYDLKPEVKETFIEGKTNDSIHSYMRDIRNIPLLSRKEEKELAYRIKQGDPEAVKKMMVCNARLVISYANKYRDRGLDIDDLIAYGNQGLYKAALKFDPEKDFKFSTYATNWIRQTISRAIADQGKTIRVPVHMHENIYRIMKIERALTQKLNRVPTNEEIAKELNDGTSPKKIDEIRRCIQDPISLDISINKEDDTKLGDFIEDKTVENPKDYVCNKLLKEEIYNLLRNTLNEREAKVLILRYGLDDGEAKTLEEVGKVFNLTRERIRQIEARALNKLRSTPDYRKLKELE